MTKKITIVCDKCKEDGAPEDMHNIKLNITGYDKDGGKAFRGYESDSHDLCTPCAKVLGLNHQLSAFERRKLEAEKEVPDLLDTLSDFIREEVSDAMGNY